MDYISKIKGPSAVLAGAGTGKTRSIIEKLKHIINNNTIPIDKVVCLTFSNEAVNNLKERIIPHLKNKEPIISTFHSFCADILRAHGNKIEIKENFKIITPDEGKILLHKYFKTPPLLCNSYINEISTKKDLGITLESLEMNSRTQEDIQRLSKELEESKFKINTNHINKLSKSEIEIIKEKRDDLENEIKQAKFLQAWKNYEKIKLANNGLDYSDLHNKALELLTKHPDITDNFEHVIVDEFQDTNKIQCNMLDRIAKNKNITVVGDLNQSIYRFRGAYEDNFNYFKQIFNVKPEEIHKLDKSYRSTNKILNIAHELIQNNYENKEDCFKVRNAHNIEGEKTKIYELKNGKEEVRKIVEIIKEEIGKNTKLNQICVIFRTHQQAMMLKKQLEYENIPFTSVNKDSLLKNTKIKLIRSYLTIAEKIINNSKGGEQAIWFLVNESIKNQKDNFTITKLIQKKKEESQCITKDFIKEEFDISKESQLHLEQIKKIINQLIEIQKLKAHEIVKKLYEILNIEDKDSIPLLEKFHSFVKDLPESDSDLSGLIYHLNTIDSLNINVEAPELIKDGVRIMTNHATKGLEYDTVIMSSLVQKKFPIERADEENKESQLTEERRLCYVGFTRAKKRLYLTYAKEYGQRKFEVSQFLNEISYQSNEDVDFIQDLEEKYQAPTVEIKQASELEDSYVSFSPSSLQLFDTCQKRYEMKYIYNMPDPVPESWEAITLGSFVHKVLERAVKENKRTEKEILDLAKIMCIDEFKDINLEDAMPMIKVFFIRNKDKYNEYSKTEEFLKTKINGINFSGFADRIDFSENGDLTIVDYKTGKSDIKPKYRNWQLGIYALASKQLGDPKRLVLEMLQKETPLEFHIDSKGIAKEIHSTRTQFSLEEVKNEIIEVANQIINAKKLGFKFCPVEKNCDFCINLK